MGFLLLGEGEWGGVGVGTGVFGVRGCGVLPFRFKVCFLWCWKSLVYTIVSYATVRSPISPEIT